MPQSWYSTAIQIPTKPSWVTAGPYSGEVARLNGFAHTGESRRACTNCRTEEFSALSCMAGMRDWRWRGVIEPANLAQLMLRTPFSPSLSAFGQGIQLPSKGSAGVNAC